MNRERQANERGTEPAERREEFRQAIHLRVILSQWGRSRRARTENLSSGGMLIVVDADPRAPIAADWPMDFTLFLDGGAAVGEPEVREVHGRTEVVRRTGTGEVALRFIELSPSDRKRIVGRLFRLQAKTRPAYTEAFA